MVPTRQFRVTKPESRITLKNETKERLNHAIPLITQAVKLYVVSKATLYRRINGRRDQVLYGISQQKLIPEEEESIKSWVLKIHL